MCWQQLARHQWTSMHVDSIAADGEKVNGNRITLVNAKHEARQSTPIGMAIGLGPYQYGWSGSIDLDNNSV